MPKDRSSRTDTRSRWNVPAMPSARYVEAPLGGTWLRAWLQNETSRGYWVQFDPDAPFRLVEEIREVSRRDPPERPAGHLPTPDVNARRGAKRRYGAWFLTDGSLTLGVRGHEQLLRQPKRGIPRGALSFGSKGEAARELAFIRRQGRYPLWSDQAEPRYLTWT